MGTILPPSRPGWDRRAVLALLAKHGVSPNHPALVGRRGYFRDTMGVSGLNDRGIYDDALALISPRFFRTFNANVDPSKFTPGVASLLANRVYWFVLGTHGITGKRPRRALVQRDARVAVQRDGAVGPTVDGIKLNVHDGGYAGTSSLGCVTIPPSQWAEFLSSVERQMSDYGEDRIPLLMTEAHS
jgi:lysozyme